MPLFASGDPDPSNEVLKNLEAKIRAKALESVDAMLSWGLDQFARTYEPAHPPMKKSMSNSCHELHDFGKQCGFFSTENPLIGKVSDNEEDFKLICSLFKSIGTIKDKSLRSLATAEIISKALAYRDLKKGQEIPIPTYDKDKPKMTTFVVDEVFDLWAGMPAFGLISKDKKAVPLLVFRGTQFALGTKRAWASMLSDLDVNGPGYSTFLRARPRLHDWLEKVSKNGKKARAMGFSLGGTLTAYTVLYEKDLISTDPNEPSLAFCPAGIPKNIFEEWELLGKNKPPLIAYVNRGDIVSKIGRLFGEVYEFSLDTSLEPIAAHVNLVTAEKLFHISLVDVSKENAAR